MTDPTRILFASDYHFGSPNINQEEMFEAFVETTIPILAETDIFFINGDFFDTTVIFDNHGFDAIYNTILHLFAACEKHQVTLRILQGTWTHDRNQLQRFKPFYRNHHCTFNFRIVEGIELEELWIRNRELRILYVPDDLPYKSSGDIVDVIKGKMVDVGWDHVDYGCMHGFFDFTFPKNISQDNVVVFRENQFPFVKKMIDVGHVHQNRVQGNVISNGSFDRHCFGDEDPKGMIRVLDYPDHYTAQFIENKNAAVYDTLMFSKDDDTEVIREKINTHLTSLLTKRKISLRCVIETLDHREAIKNWMKDVYPDVALKIKLRNDDDDKQIMIPSSALFTPVEKRISPTPKTIASFIRAHIAEEYPLTIEDIDRYLEPVSDKA